MTGAPPSAVFLSYASQDAAAVQRIAEALRAAGVEVWFDRNELVGGDAWDAKIRRQIAECALFVPVISAATQARREGYFRIEWRLAAQRTHAMSDDTTFLLPVVIDDTRDADARVPAEFKAVQWTRLPGSESTEKFCARVQRLLAGTTGETAMLAAAEKAQSLLPPPRTQAGRAWRTWGWGGLVAAGIAAMLYFGLKPGAPRSSGAPASPPPRTAAAPGSEAQKLVAQARKIYDDGDELNRENLLLAEELVQRAIDRDPAEASAWELATWLSYTMVWHSIDGSEARRDQLSRQATRLLALAPESVSARIVHANARLTPGWAGATVQSTREKAIQEIERDLQVLAQREPENWQIQRALATAYRFLNRTDESIAAMRRAVALSGGHPTAVGDLINVLVRRGRHTEAETVLASGLARRPTGRLLTFAVLLKTRWRGDTAAAVSSVESEAWPAWLTREDRGAFFAWQAYFWAGRADPALAVVRGVPRDYLRDANFSGPRAVLSARAHERAGQTVAAQADWRQVVQVAERELALHPDELSALYWKAWALARLGDLETARTLCALIQQRSQGDQPVFLRGTHLSALLATAGLVDAALQDLRTYRATFTDGYVITRAVLELDPAFDPLRADPRFQEIVQAAPAPAEATAKPGEKSVAVLPFVNQSADKDNEYFSDGIAEELLTVLQKIPGLRVAARTSAWSFKGKNPTAQEVGEKLGAAHVVEGSVQKFGNKVKITARLSRAATNVAVWSKSFGPLEPTDLFATQSELAAAIATELRGRLTGDSTGGAATEMVALVQAAQKGGTKNAEAHELYLRGKFLANQFSLESFARAEALLQQAVERDSNFALAWALLAQVGRLRSGWGNTRPEVEAGYALSEQASGRAVELAPDLPEAHLARVNFQLIAFDWKGARASVRRLLELAPTTALESEMRLATALGERDRAVAAGRKAVAADPVNPELRVNFAFALVNARRLEDAEAEFRRAVEMSVASPVGYAGIALVKLLQGKAGEAAAAASRESSGWARTQAIALARWGEGDRAGAEAALAELSEREGDVAAYQVAQVYGFRGDADNAFRWLERALRQRDPGLSFCGSEILFESLHADPRWPAFLRKIGLHDEQLQELR